MWETIHLRNFPLRKGIPNYHKKDLRKNFPKWHNYAGNMEVSESSFYTPTIGRKFSVTVLIDSKSAAFPLVDS